MSWRSYVPPLLLVVSGSSSISAFFFPNWIVVTGTSLDR
jgi:hypothetical protein